MGLGSMLGFEKIPADVKAKSFYDLKASLPGKDKVYDFAELKGKPVLIVNTASKWYVCIPASPRNVAELARGLQCTCGTGRQQGSLVMADQ